MRDRTERKILAQLLAKVRRRLFFKTACHSFMRAMLVSLPMGALLVAADQRWNGGRLSIVVAFAAAIGAAAFGVFFGLRGLGERVRSALTLDEHAHLQDRVSSAWEFMELRDLSEAHLVQIRDAIQHAEGLNFGKVFGVQWPRQALALPLVLALLVFSFFVPSISPAKPAAKDPLRLAQLQQLEELKQELAAKQDLPEEIQDAIRKLEDVRKQFERGEIGERDVMLQLARLDEVLRSKVAELPVENLEAEMNAMVPHLSASAATLSAAKAMKEQQFDKAAQELKNLADKVEEKKLAREEQKQLAAQLGVAAAKLGKKKSSDSFSSDLAQASESLEKSDSEGFKSATKGMSDKLGTLKKSKLLKQASNKIGMCKGGLCQCTNSVLGYCLSPQTLNKSKGGLKAGSSTAGDPLGDANRLADSYKKMLQIAGQAGQGPTETETEITEGQLSQSQLKAKELHASYTAAAEEVIEKENIPLSHRYHVKRYFQAIRPQE